MRECSLHGRRPRSATLELRATPLLPVLHLQALNGAEWAPLRQCGAKAVRFDNSMNRLLARTVAATSPKALNQWRNRERVCSAGGSEAPTRWRLLLHETRWVRSHPLPLQHGVTCELQCAAVTTHRAPRRLPRQSCKMQVHCMPKRRSQTAYMQHSHHEFSAAYAACSPANAQRGQQQCASRGGGGVPRRAHAHSRAQATDAPNVDPPGTHAPEQTPLARAAF